MNRLFVLSLVFACAGLAADQDTAAPGITRSQADAILDELRQIHTLLEKLQPNAPAQSPTPPAPAPPARVTLKLDASLDHIGKDDAPLTIVEFSDYECAFCRQFHLTAYRDIRKNYIETGRVRFFSLDLPLEMHANAKPAALAAHCAGEQGQYWSMREALIGNGGRLSPDIILEVARALYLNVPAFQKCVDAGKYNPVMERAMQQASSLSITGTPTFIIGKTTKEGIDGALFIGVMPYADFERELKKLAADQ
jgi:protein-disulfide isomerase